jgi:tetratricopeptide (TPR) repeat protein
MSIINEIRSAVTAWREKLSPDKWGVTPETARLLLKGMSAHFTDSVQEDYLWGILLWRQGDYAEAQVRLARVLELQPGHELARAELGAVLEAKNDLEGALPMIPVANVLGCSSITLLQSWLSITNIKSLLERQGIKPLQSLGVNACFRYT